MLTTLQVQVAIRELAETFARGVLDAVRASSLEEILNGGPSRVPASGRRRGRRKSSGVSSTDVDRIAYVVGKNPTGIRSEELRARLSLEKVAFRNAVAAAVAANLITKTGEKRSTTFFPSALDVAAMAATRRTDEKLDALQDLGEGP